MIQLLLFLLVVGVGFYYAFTYGKKSKAIIKHYDQPKDIVDETAMVLWEDDYLMVELMPSNNLAYAQKQIGVLTDTSGITYMETKELGILKAELSDLLNLAGLSEYENIIHTGIIKPFYIKSTVTRAFGSLGNAIFFDGKEEVVEHIWLSSIHGEEINKTAIAEGLHAMGEKYDLILVDIYPVNNTIVDLKNMGEIKRYLKDNEE